MIEEVLRLEFHRHGNGEAADTQTHFIAALHLYQVQLFSLKAKDKEVKVISVAKEPLPVHSLMFGDSSFCLADVCRLDGRPSLQSLTCPSQIPEPPQLVPFNWRSSSTCAEATLPTKETQLSFHHNRQK